MVQDDQDDALRTGVSLVEAGRDAEALAALERACAHGADDMLAHNARGRALLGLGRTEAALAAFRLAADRAGDDPAPRMNAGLALAALGRHAEALAEFEAVIARWPALHAAHRQRALALVALGRLDVALAALQAILAERPDDATALTDRGNLRIRMEQFAAALDSFTQAAAMQPDDATAHYNRGIALQYLEQPAAAVEAFDAALRIDPGMLAARVNRANSLRRLNRYDEALAEYRTVLAARPDNLLALGNLGKAMAELGERAEALACLEKAVAAAPDHAELRWLRTVATIPSVRHAGDDLATLRADYAAALEVYDRWAVGAGDLPAWVNVGRPHPFFIAYQEANNRDLMARLGAINARVMARWRDDAGLAAPPPRTAPPPAGRPLRVGIVSAHVMIQSVWLAIVRGWLEHADKSRVAYHVFHLAAQHDAETERARRMAAGFEYGVRGLRDWVRAIQAAAPDVLVYPEIGMDDLTVKLASLRLAPVQVATWGHPETTGLPTIDAFVSAVALEPPGAQAHYTERLLCLPRLGCCYTPLPMPEQGVDLAALGLRADRPVLLCPGVPFKYVPEYDHVYVAIARAAPDAQLVFFRQDVNPRLSEAVFARLGAAFAAAGLDIAAHARLIPWQSHAGFYGLMRRADLFLDTIGFSGFNTAIQAMECGLPVVTMEGRFMRGRLASGILREMEMPEMVATSPDDYARIAASLANDPPARMRAREKTLRNRARLFGDVGAVRAFEDALHALCAGAAA